MSRGAGVSGVAFGDGSDDTDPSDRYRTLVDTIDDGIWQLDAEQRLVAVNDVFAERTGYEREALLGERVTAILADGSALEREIERLRADPEERGELLDLSVLTADGRQVPCEVRVNLIEADGTVQGAVGVVRDLTERRRRERRAEFRDRLGEAIQSLTDPGEIAATATRLLGEHLRADRCVLADAEAAEDRSADAEAVEGRSADAEAAEDRAVDAESDEDLSADAESTDVRFDVLGEYASSDDDRLGDGPVSHLGDVALALLQEDRAYVVEDVDADERVGEAERAAYERAGIQSAVLVPFHEDGTLVAVLALYEERPRDWQSHEVGLVGTVLQRCRESLQRARTMRELREREEHLRALVETTPECIKSVAPDGTLLQMNPAGLEMVQADEAGTVLGESVYDLIAPEDRERFREFNERICHEGERGTLEFDVVGLDGERRHMETHAAPLRRPDGSTSQVALTRDVTEREEREQALEESNRRLEETNRRLEESNERLEQFAYAASHDLQEPLRMVSSYLQLLEQRHGEELDGDAREFLEFAVDGADRMRDMIEGLLEYSRVETKGEPFEPVELDDVVADVRDDLRVRIEESDAEIEVGELPEVEGDREQLRQLFQNLLDNAIEYSGDEPPRIEVAAERYDGEFEREAGGQCEAADERDGAEYDGADPDADEWVLSVSDCGIGIDLTDVDRVFEVFQSLHTPGKRAGTGIGLALCQRIVERHGGEIRVDSEPGEGATFSFTLPAADDVES